MAGGSLLSHIRLIERHKENSTWTLGAIGRFEIKASGEPYGLNHRLDVWLDRFEADLAEHNRRVSEAEQRSPG